MNATSSSDFDFAKEATAVRAGIFSKAHLPDSQLSVGFKQSGNTNEWLIKIRVKNCVEDRRDVVRSAVATAMTAYNEGRQISGLSTLDHELVFVDT